MRGEPVPGTSKRLKIRNGSRNTTLRERADGKIIGSHNGYDKDHDGKARREWLERYIAKLELRDPDMTVIERENGAKRPTANVLTYEEMEKMGLVPTGDLSFFYIRDERGTVFSVFQPQQKPKHKSSWYKRLKRLKRKPSHTTFRPGFFIADEQWLFVRHEVDLPAGAVPAY